MGLLGAHGRCCRDDGPPLETQKGKCLTDKIAVYLGLALFAFIAANFILGWELQIFLGRKLLELTEYLAFWR